MPEKGCSKSSRIQANIFFFVEDDSNLEAFRASPAAHVAAPNNKRSLARNCPGMGDKNGKPYSGCHTPGVEKIKVNVIKNI